MESLQQLLVAIERQRAERTAAIGDVSSGACLMCESGSRWVFLLPDMTEPGKWRMQRFDERGFSGHSIFNTQEELVSAAAAEGFFRHDPGALDRLQGTALFQRGNFLTDLVQRVNAREISHAEADRLLAEHDAQPA